MTAILSAWSAVLPYLAAALIVLFVPGWMTLRALGLRGAVSAAAAPAVSSAIVGTAAIVLPMIGLGWSVATAGGFALVVVLAAAGLGNLARRGPASLGAVRAPARSGRWAVIGGLVVGAVVQLAVDLPAIADPTLPIQNRDAVFHLNATQAILDTGNASSLDGLAPMYGGRAVYYPAVWHAMVALFTDPTSVVVGSNALGLVVSVLVWPLGLAALAHAVWPHDATAAALAPVLGSAFAVFPPAVMHFHGQWPFGLSVATWPAAVALAVLAVRATWRPVWAGVLGAALACLGVTLAHPSGAAALGVAAASLGATAIVRVSVRDLRRGRPWRAAGLVGGAVAAVLAVAWVLVNNRQLQAMASFVRPEGDRGEALVTALGLRTAVPYTWIPDEGNLVLVVLGALGMVAMVARPGNRWLPLAAASLVVLTALAAGPEGRLRALTAFWYKDELRLRALVVTLAAVLAAVGVAAATRYLTGLLRTATWRRRTGLAVPAAAVVLFVLTTGLHHDLRYTQWVAAGYHPDYMVAPPLASLEEITFIESLEDRLEPDAVLVGDPLSGVVLTQALIGVESYVPVIGDSGTSEDQATVLETFADLDAEICAILNEADVQYYYEDRVDGQFLGAVPPAEGFADVDTSTGFELVAESGTARLWRITACA